MCLKETFLLWKFKFTNKNKKNHHPALMSFNKFSNSNWKLLGKLEEGRRKKSKYWRLKQHIQLYKHFFYRLILSRMTCLKFIPIPAPTGLSFIFVCMLPFSVWLWALPKLTLFCTFSKYQQQFFKTSFWAHFSPLKTISIFMFKVSELANLSVLLQKKGWLSVN